MEEKTKDEQKIDELIERYYPKYLGDSIKLKMFALDVYKTGMYRGREIYKGNSAEIA